MTHPEHGVTHAFTQSELRDLRMRGFVEEGGHAPSQTTRDALIPAVSLHEGRDEMTIRRKPGRPPKAK